MQVDSHISWLESWMDLFRENARVSAIHCLEDLNSGQRPVSPCGDQWSPEGTGKSRDEATGPADSLGRCVVFPTALPLPGLGALVEALDAEQKATHMIMGGSENTVLAVLCCCTEKVENLLRAIAVDPNIRWTETTVRSNVNQVTCACPSQLAHRYTVPSDRVYSLPVRDSASPLAFDECFYEPPEMMRSRLFITFDPEILTGTTALLPLEYLLDEPSPLGAYGRLLCNAAGNSMHPRPSSSNPFTLADVDIIAVTTDRWRCVRELLRSIRNTLGNSPNITVVAQTPSSHAWQYLAKRFDTRIIHVEVDLGLSASRNAAVEATHRPLVWLMDDDYQLDERCRAQAALQIMSTHPTIDVLGGNLLDVSTWSAPREAEQSQSFAMKALRNGKHLTWIRLEDAPRERHFCDYSTYVEYCDIVDNFAIFRRETTFDREVRWNPRLKINGEHQDIYLKFLALGDVTVARTNALKVRNVRVQSPKYRAMRNRQDEFFGHFFRAHDLMSFRIVGGWARLLCGDGRTAARAFNSPWGHRPEFGISRETF